MSLKSPVYTGDFCHVTQCNICCTLSCIKFQTFSKLRPYRSSKITCGLHAWFWSCNPEPDKNCIELCNNHLCKWALKSPRRQACLHFLIIRQEQNFAPVTPVYMLCMGKWHLHFERFYWVCSSGLQLPYNIVIPIGIRAPSDLGGRLPWPKKDTFNYR